VPTEGVSEVALACAGIFDAEEAGPWDTVCKPFAAGIVSFPDVRTDVCIGSPTLVVAGVSIVCIGACTEGVALWLFVIIVEGWVAGA
jgi:hypothetical protein